MQKVKEKSLPKEPSVMLIPRKDEGPYLLSLFNERIFLLSKREKPIQSTRLNW